MENKIDWSKVDWEKFATLFAKKYIEFEREKHRKFTEYWKYHLFTPTYLKIWHKITLKKTPKL